MCLFLTLKMLHNNVLYDSVKVACSSKPGSSVVVENSWTNQISGFFDHQYFWKQSIDRLDFLPGGNHQGKVAPGTTSFGWVWPIKLSLSFNQIAGFLYHQYLWKESIDVFDILHVDGHQRKLVSEAITLVGCGQVPFPIRLQDSLIISISGRNKQYLKFVAWR